MRSGGIRRSESRDWIYSVVGMIRVILWAQIMCSNFNSTLSSNFTFTLNSTKRKTPTQNTRQMRLSIGLGFFGWPLSTNMG